MILGYDRNGLPIKVGMEVKTAAGELGIVRLSKLTTKENFMIAIEGKRTSFVFFDKVTRTGRQDPIYGPEMMSWKNVKTHDWVQANETHTDAEGKIHFNKGAIGIVLWDDWNDESSIIVEWRRPVGEMMVRCFISHRALTVLDKEPLDIHIDTDDEREWF